jgi:hypothetical protein
MILVGSGINIEAYRKGIYEYGTIYRELNINLV